MPEASIDATAAIGLSKGGVFELLPRLFSTVYLPRSVRSELVGRGLPGEAEVLAALGDWLSEVIPAPSSVHKFSSLTSAADREVLAVADERSLDYVLSDDRKVQRAADLESTAWLNTPDIVLAFKQIGAVNAVKPVLDQMIANGFGISAVDYQDTLQAAGE